MLDDFSTICQQKIVFAENLVELAKTIKGEELYTSIIPIGSRTEGNEKKLTIKSVADFDDGEFIKRGDRLYHKEAVEKYGTIVRMVTWDKVDTTSRLLENAKIRLRKNVNIQTSIGLSAADLASINADISSFKLGNYVRIKSKPHDIDDDYLIKKISLDLLKPSSNKLTIGASFSSFSENQSTIEKNISDLKQQTSDNADGLNLLNAQIKTLDGTVTTLGEATAQIIEKTTPSNWTNLVISDDYKPYDDLTENYPKFKKMNNIVCVRGILSPKESYTSSTTAVTIASGLPPECRPPKNLTFVCQGSGMNRWTLHITTSGDIKMNRYGISTYATVPTTAWLSFAICYSV